MMKNVPRTLTIIITLMIETINDTRRQPGPEGPEPDGEGDEPDPGGDDVVGCGRVGEDQDPPPGKEA